MVEYQTSSVDLYQCTTRGGAMIWFKFLMRSEGKVTRHAPAGGTTEGSLAATIRGSANRIFLAGLGAFAKTQQEGSKVFDSLVDQGTTVFDELLKEGEALTARTVGAADETMADMRTAAADTWKRLEGIFEDRVAAVAHGLNLATKSDIDKLARRLSAVVATSRKPAGAKKKPPARAAAHGAGRRSRTKRSR